VKINHGTDHDEIEQKNGDTEKGGGRGKFIGATGDAGPLIFEIAE